MDYNEEMYKYLTLSGNYKAAKTISEFLNNEVEPQLNKEFWAMVEGQLKLALKESMNNSVNHLEVDESVENFRKSNWNGVYIARENDDLGIKIDLDLIDRKAVVDLLNIKNSDKHLGDKETQTWPCYFKNWLNTTGDFFNKLPETRETKISEQVNIIFNYIEMATNICDDINNLRK